MEALGQAGTPSALEEYKAAFNKFAKNRFETYHSNIDFRDKSNPFVAQSAEQIAQSQAVQETRWWQQTFKDTDLQEVNPTDMIDLTIARLQDKAMTPEEAALGLSTFFKEATLINNGVMGGMHRVGLPTQESYNVRVRKPNVNPALSGGAFKFSGSKIPNVSGKPSTQGTYMTVDFSDYTQVINFLAIQKAASKNLIK